MGGLINGDKSELKYEPNAWIKIITCTNEETYYAVNINILKWFDFFRSLISDVTLTDFFEDKPIILCIENSQLSYITVQNFNYMYECVKKFMTNKFFCEKIDIVEDQVNYILLLNHFATPKEINMLMQYIDFLPQTYLQIVNFPFIHWDAFFSSYCKKIVIKSIILNKPHLQNIKDICKFYDILYITSTCENVDISSTYVVYSCENRSFYNVYLSKHDNIYYYFCIDPYTANIPYIRYTYLFPYLKISNVKKIYFDNKIPLSLYCNPDKGVDILKQQMENSKEFSIKIVKFLTSKYLLFDIKNIT